MIELVLLDVSESYAEDRSADRLKAMLQKIPSSSSTTTTSCCCCLSGTYLNAWKHNDPGLLEHNSRLWERIQSKICDKMRPRERYLTWASILLKSRALQQVYPMDSNRDEEATETVLSLVELPRTPYNKPFIPPIQLDSFDEHRNHNRYPLSVSHQYPFVGVARLAMAHGIPLQEASSSKRSSGKEMDKNRDNEKEREEKIRKLPLLVLGFDIVIFEPLNKRMYKTVMNFVEVFESSFTHREYSNIQASGTKGSLQYYHGSGSASGDDTLEGADFVMHRELYLRWAVKEAYTKALGVGLGFEFGTFETHFEELSNHNDSLWIWLASRLQKRKRQLAQNVYDGDTSEKDSLNEDAFSLQWPFLFEMTGTVKHLRVDEELDVPVFPGKYRFFFGPLFQRRRDKETSGEQYMNADNMVGATCLCLGPIPKELNLSSGTKQVEDKQKEGVALWHCRIQWLDLQTVMSRSTGP